MSPPERIVLDPAHRREAIVTFIRDARERLALSLFRCDDFKILDALAEAIERRVRVSALITPRAKNWDKRLRDLGVFLESMGVEVHRFSGSSRKYHAKYMIADQDRALIASLNLTRKCFDSTCDFIHFTADHAVVDGLSRLFAQDCDRPEARLPKGISDRLIVGPDRSRSRYLDLIRHARRTLRIIDHRVTDPEILEALKRQRDSGIDIEVKGWGAVDGLVSHGKMMLVDDDTAVIGSISMSTPSLDLRREVAIVIRETACLASLRRLFGRGVGLHEAPPAPETEDDEE